MKRLASLIILVLAFAPLAAMAQGEYNHAEVGAFADYFQLHNADNANFWGVGARLDVNVHSHVQLEAQMAYDFEKTLNISGISGTGSFSRTNLRLLSGDAGPKINFAIHGLRPFVFLKGGVLNFRATSGAVTLGNFSTAAQSILNGDSNGVFYPGGGLEFFAGPLGLRVDIGDYMYFDNGANHNLRITAGPVFRF